MDNDQVEQVAKVAYEAHRDAVREISPSHGPWEQVGDINKHAWRQVARAVLEAGSAGQADATDG